MHCKIKIFVRVFSVITALFTVVTCHGKFNLTNHAMVPCKGPRHKDCVRPTYNILPGGRIIQMFMDNIEISSLDTIRIVGYKTETKKKTTPFIDMKLDHPCEIPALRQVFGHILFYDNERSCHIMKGQYNVTYDSWYMARRLWAGSFFYGNFTFRSVSYGPKCNILCVLTNLTFSPA